jgi:hypothetical protein
MSLLVIFEQILLKTGKLFISFQKKCATSVSSPLGPNEKLFLSRVKKLDHPGLVEYEVPIVVNCVTQIKF